MAKNILIFSDGTGQAGGLKPDQRLSNIYKLYRATRVAPDNSIDPSQQVAYYDVGLGTDVDSSRVPFRLARSFRKLASSATGTGIGTNIAECYAAILKSYEPGDRIYLFGFSRGAYTVRCLANVLSLCGVPTHDADGKALSRYGKRINSLAIEAVRDIYEHGLGRDDLKLERAEKAKRFRGKYGSDDDGVANVAPYFIGVFDTVAALGMPLKARLGLAGALCAGVAAVWTGLTFWLDRSSLAQGFLAATLALAVLCGTWYLLTRIRVIRDFPEPGSARRHFARLNPKAYDLHLDTRVRFARHAVAIDEIRKDFARVGWGHRGDKVSRNADEPEWFKQIWFPGCHSDIGGSYEEDESRLSDVALSWMVGEASALPFPVLIDRSKLNLFPSSAGMQHCEVRSFSDAHPILARLGIGWKIAIRKDSLGAPLHPSVMERMAMDKISQSGDFLPYRPEALRADPSLAHYYAKDP